MERQTITGGDVLQIEDFNVDMMKVMNNVQKESNEETKNLVKVRQSAVLKLIRKIKPGKTSTNGEERNKQELIREVVNQLDLEAIPRDIGRKV